MGTSHGELAASPPVCVSLFLFSFVFVEARVQVSSLTALHLGLRWIAH